MPAYDHNVFDPPAPLARVSLRAPHNAAIVTEVPMLIDSGSDVTLIPATFLDSLGMKPDESQSYELASFDGERSTTNSVRLELIFQGRNFRGRFLLLNSASGILGRNVLNHLALVLDGPALNWEVRPTPQ